MSVKQIIEAMQELRAKLALNERITPKEFEQLEDLVEAIRDGLKDYER